MASLIFLSCMDAKYILSILEKGGDIMVVLYGCAAIMIITIVALPISLFYLISDKNKEA